MIESVEGFRVGRKRRALSSACLFFHGLALTVVGVLYVYDPKTSLDIIAEAWAVQSIGDSSSEVATLARNVVMVAAVYLAVWGAICMTLSTVAIPRTKKALAVMNLVAALAVATCSAFHPLAVANKTCRDSVDAAFECFSVAMKWHAPLVALDLLAILFAEAGPRYVRISDNATILLNGDVSEQVRNTTIKKINSHTDLITHGKVEEAAAKKKK